MVVNPPGGDALPNTTDVPDQGAAAGEAAVPGASPQPEPSLPGGAAIEAPAGGTETADIAVVGATGGGDAGLATSGADVIAGAPNVQVGSEVYTADGEKLGTVKEIAGDRFKVDVRLQPDYWLSLSNVQSTEDAMVTLAFGNERLGEYKVDGPTSADAAT